MSTFEPNHDCPDIAVERVEVEPKPAQLIEPRNSLGSHAMLTVLTSEEGINAVEEHGEVDEIVTGKPLTDQQREELEKHTGLAHFIVSEEYPHVGPELHEDLISVALEGLTRACTNFDPKGGAQFSTYACSVMKGKLRNHFRDYGELIRKPRPLYVNTPRVAEAEETLYAVLGRKPFPSELAAKLGLPEPLVRECLHYKSTVSLDHDASGEDHEQPPLLNFLGSEDSGFAGAEMRALLVPLINSLEPPDRQILYLSFWQDMTQLEISVLVGLSQMTVSRTLARVKKILKQGLEKSDILADGTSADE